MSNNTYIEMVYGKHDKPKIRPTIVERNEDENKIKTIYLIRDMRDEDYRYEPNISNNALEFHVIYDKKTGKSSGALYYDTYNIDYTRQTGAKVQDPHEKNSKQAHEGYKCTNLSRCKVQFFPPEINNINALDKYIENRFNADLTYLNLIGTIEMEGLKQTLRKQFKLNQNTEILTYIFDELGSDFFYQQSNNEYFFGAAFFNNRFFLFREFLDKKLQLLECKPAREIRTRGDFYDFTGDCFNKLICSDYLFARGSNLRENAAILIDNPRFFKQEKKENPRQQRLGKGRDKWKKLQDRKSSEKKEVELNMNYKDTLIEKDNREPADPVMDNLICKALETVALQGYKHFTKKDIGFRYSCVDGLKVQHNIQDKQRIGLIEKRLQFFKKQQLKRQLNHIQIAGNEIFANERLHD